jgi:hypothetical protein
MVKSLWLSTGRGGYELKQDLSTLSTRFPRLKKLVCPPNFQLGMRLAPHLGTFFNLHKMYITLPDGLLLPRLLDVRRLKVVIIRIENGSDPVPAMLPPFSPIDDQQRTLSLDRLDIVAHHLDDFILSFLESVHARAAYLDSEHGDIGPWIDRLSPITTLHLTLWHDDSPLLLSALSSFTNLRSLTLRPVTDHPLDNTFYTQIFNALLLLGSFTIHNVGRLNAQDLLQALSACPLHFHRITLKGISPTD